MRPATGAAGAEPASPAAANAADDPTEHRIATGSVESGDSGRPAPANPLHQVGASVVGAVAGTFVSSLAATSPNGTLAAAALGAAVPAVITYVGPWARLRLVVGLAIVAAALVVTYFGSLAFDAAADKKTFPSPLPNPAKPTIRLSRPADGETYRAGGVVRASFACNAGAGERLRSCRGDVPNHRPIDTSAGEHTFEVVATDRDGNTTTKRVTYLVVARGPVADTTRPAIALDAPSDGATYDAESTVIARFICSDQGSGIRSCHGTVESGNPIDTSPGNHDFTVSATDRAGHQTSKTATYTVPQAEVDETDPTIAIASPMDGATYDQYRAQIADFSCNDASGIAVCTGTMASGARIDTSEPGPHEFTVTATDKADHPNTATKTITYSVVPVIG